MSAALQGTVVLNGQFAHELPELSIAWKAEPTPEPNLLVLNTRLAGDLGLEAGWLRSAGGLGLLTGTAVPEGATPVAQGYAGHQFGSYSPRLGDGRALLMGELRGPDGTLHDLHLKGSGRTPFSRGGDGLAAMGPMLREYLVSEAMHALGIPTTRALAVVATGTTIRRDTPLPGAVLARIASSHVRVGSFQYARAQGDVDLLRRLADHAISRLHPEAATAEHPYRALFDAVVSVQAQLVAQWMLVGFVHGVMNTDNMTISGETIDYGPCAFMDGFDPAALYSSIDAEGRYAYRNQPVIAEWNLARLAEALLPLLDDDEDQAVEAAMSSLRSFRDQYSAAWSTGMRGKLGLAPVDAGAPEAPAVVDDVIVLLQQHGVDYTTFFRRLGAAARGDSDPVRSLFADTTAYDAWAAAWSVLGPDADLMDRTNPAYIPRNHLVEEALAAATAGNLEPFEELLDVVTDPYRERPGLERYASGPPEDFGPYRTFCGT